MNSEHDRPLLFAALIAFIFPAVAQTRTSIIPATATPQVCLIAKDCPQRPSEPMRPQCLRISLS